MAVSEHEQEVFEASLDKWAQDPTLWMREILGIEPWSKQKEVCESVLHCRRTSVRSANGVGKSFIAAATALWYLYTHPGSLVVTTAPGWQQVENIIWGEIRKMWNNSLVPLGGRLLNTQIDCTDDKDMRALGMKAKYKHMAIGLSTDDVERFRGLHADTGDILIIADEAQGVTEQIYDGIETLMTNEGARLLLIGNPTRLTGTFFDSHRDPQRSEIYNKIHISAYDLPNVKEGKNIIPGATSRSWVDERKREWGAESALFQACVLGEFPSNSEDALFQIDWIEQAMTADIEAEGYEPRVLAIDVARHGDNDTCYLYRHGNVVKWIELRKGKDATYTVGKAIELMREQEIEPDIVVVDDVGVGGTVGDFLAKHFNVVGFIPGNRDEMDDSERFGNLRMECYWKLKERFRVGKIKIPKLERLKNELLSLPKPEPHEDGKLYIMGKEKMRSEGVKSPDVADALMMSEYGWKLASMKERSRRPFSHTPKTTEYSRTGY